MNRLHTYTTLSAEEFAKYRSLLQEMFDLDQPRLALRVMVMHIRINNLRVNRNRIAVRARKLDKYVDKLNEDINVARFTAKIPDHL